MPVAGRRVVGDQVRHTVVVDVGHPLLRRSDAVASRPARLWPETRSRRQAYVPLASRLPERNQIGLAVAVDVSKEVLVSPDCV